MPRVLVRDFGSSILFPRSGNTSNIIVKNGTILAGTTNFSIAGWVKLNLGAGNSSIIYSERASSGNAIVKLQMLNSNRNLGWTYRDSGGGLSQYTGSIFVKDNNWHFMVVTKQGTNVNTYVDCVLNTANTMTSNDVLTDANMESRIGSDKASTGEQMDGWISDVSLYNKTLSLAEIQALYYSNIQPSGCIDRWKLNEGSGTTAIDSVGSNNGTISNATYSTDTPTVPRILSINRVLTQNFNSSLASGTASGSGPDVSTTNVSASFWMDFRRAVGHVYAGFYNGGTVSDSLRFNIETNTAKPFIFVTAADTTQTTALKPNFSWPTGWGKVCFTYNFSNQLVKIYCNGVLIGSTTSTKIARASDTFAIFAQTSQAGVSGVNVYARELTDAEALLDYQVGVAATPYLTWPMSEGAGSINYDISGNGRNSAIISSAFSANVPTKKRKLVGSNLILNGDFEIAPPNASNTPTTTATKYIDGTVAGSILPDTGLIFGAWSSVTTSLNASAAYDYSVSHSGTCSMRLSCLTTGVTVTAGQGRTTTFPNTFDIFPLLPNTSYTMTCWIKTNNAASLAGYVDFREYNGDGSANITYSTAKLSGTNDWTQLTVTTTVSAAARWGRIFLRNNVVGNISDVWFDDIVLTPTTNTTRQLVA